MDNIEGKLKCTKCGKPLRLETVYVGGRAHTEFYTCTNGYSWDGHTRIEKSEIINGDGTPKGA